MTSQYFDWAATAPADEDILAEAVKVSIDYSANPGSVHEAGIQAKHKLEEARKRCATALGVKDNTIIFTSGGTESNYIPIVSLLQRQGTGSILISAIEHSAVKEQALSMERRGWKVITVPCDTNGIVQPESVMQKLQDDTALVCIMAVNNETGAIQPIYDIADRLCQHCKGKRRPKFHVDAVQAVGKVALNLAHSGIDTVAISAHKIRGPRGVGLLYMADRQEPFLRGGGQENGLRSGTENLLGIWALSRCLERYVDKTELAKKVVNQTQNMNAFMQKLNSLSTCTLIPACRLSSPQTEQRYSPWILQASFHGIPGEVLVRALSEKGIYISTGSACSSRKNNRSVLSAMGIEKTIATNTVRFSFGPQTQATDIDELFSAVKEIFLRFN